MLDTLDDSDEEVQIWEEGPDGEKKLSKKSYGMHVVEDRIGFKIRLDDQYYNQFAQDQYTLNAEKLLMSIKQKKVGEEEAKKAEQ